MKKIVMNKLDNMTLRLVVMIAFILSAVGCNPMSRKPSWSKVEILDGYDFNTSNSMSRNWDLHFNANGDGIFYYNPTDQFLVRRFSSNEGWSQPELIDDTAHPSEDTDFSGAEKSGIRTRIDDAGNMLVTWKQNSTAWLNKYTVGKGWGRAEKIESSPSDNYAPELASDAQGNLYAAWTHNDYKTEKYQIFGKVYTPKNGWGKIALLSEHAGDAEILQLKVNAAGHAYIMWKQGKDKEKRISDFSFRSSFRIFVSRYEPKSGWSKAEMIVTDIDGDFLNRSSMGLDSLGNANIIWSENIDSKDIGMLWSRRFDVANGWEPAVRIDSEPKIRKRARFVRPYISFDAMDNAIAVWCNEIGGGMSEILTNRYTNGKGWGKSELVSGQSNVQMCNRHVVFDRQGNALKVWADRSLGKESIMASRYTKGQGWSEPLQISDRVASADYPEMAMDEQGNATVIWLEGGTFGKSILVNYYDVAQGWSKPKILQNDRTYSATRPAVVMDGRGLAHVSWAQSLVHQEPYHILTKRYQTPEQFKQIKNLIEPKEASEAEYNIISATRNNSPLHLAALAGDFEKFKKLVEDVTDINIKNVDDSLPIHMAARGGHKAVVEFLLSKGVNVNARDREGNSPLHEAAGSGALDVALLLIERGAQLNSKATGRETPLIVAIEAGQNAVAKLLISRGAEVNRYKSTYDNPLRRAVDKGNVEVVTLLLSNGFNVKVAEDNGETLLSLAVEKDRLDVATLLISHGADVNSRTKFGVTPLHHVKSKEMVALLVSKGAKVNAKRTSGLTPLHDTAHNKLIEVCEALVAHGADINAVDEWGAKPAWRKK